MSTIKTVCLTAEFCQHHQFIPSALNNKLQISSKRYILVHPKAFYSPHNKTKMHFATISAAIATLAVSVTAVAIPMADTNADLARLADKLNEFKKRGKSLNVDVPLTTTTLC
jgi:hypothetical protein